MTSSSSDLSAALNAMDRSGRRLVILTDLHLTEEEDVQPVLRPTIEALVGQVNGLRPDLVLMAGDLVNDGIKISEDEAKPRWELLHQLIGRIDAPVECGIGNHDLVGGAPKKGKPSDNPRAAWREETGNADTYRSFDALGHRFLLLDTVLLERDFKDLSDDEEDWIKERIPLDKTDEESLRRMKLSDFSYIGRVGGEQLEWMRGVLDETPADVPVVLSSHIPLHTLYYQVKGGPMTGLPPNRVVTDREAVLKCFDGRPAPVIIQGHVHIDETLTRNALRFFTAGAVCGDKWEGDRQGTPPGFGVMDLAAEAGAAPVYRYVPIRGMG